jgi:putative salt-induced outer membrane protein YdiY
VVTVKLANGDVIKATLVAEKPDSVTIKHPVLGDLTLPRTSVAAVTAVPPAADSAVTQADVAKTNLGPAGNAAIDAPKPVDTVNPANDAAKVGTGPAAAPAAPAPPPPPSPWKLIIDANANYVSAANDQLDFRVAASAVYERKDIEKWSTSAEFFYKTVDSNNTDNNLLLSTTYDHRFEQNTRWLWFAKGQAQYAPLENYEERLSAWGGIGYEFMQKKPVKLIGKIGAGYTYEFGNINDGYPELYAEIEGDWDITDNQQLVGSVWITPAFNDFTNALMLARLEWTLKVPDFPGTKLLGGLRWQYQTQVPAGDIQSDFRIYAGLRFEL